MDAYSLITIIASIGCVLLANFVYYRNKNSRLLIMFAIGYALTGFYCFSIFGFYMAFDSQEAWIWLRLSAFVHFITPIILHCIFILTQKVKFIKYPILIYIPAILLFIQKGIFTELTYNTPVPALKGWAVKVDVYSPWHIVDMAYYIVVISWEFFMLLSFTLKKGVNVFKRRLAFFMLLTILVPCLLMTFLLYIFPFVQNMVVRIETIFIFFVFVFTTIGLFRYNIFDLTAEVLSRDIVSNMSNFYILADKDANILELNPKTTQVLKYKPEELMGGNLLKLFSQIDYDKLFRTTPDNKFYTNETYCISKEKKLIPVLLSITAVYLKSEFLGYIIIGSDLSNVKRILEEKEIAELELKALQAQMNPHFLFNSLNTIQHFISINDEIKANEYLSKFARLMRKVLDNSSASQISLKEELDTIKLYLDLEGLRLKDKFNYSIEIDESINLYTHKIPRMIIQPYLENAIWHGILPKKLPGTLKLSFNQSEDVVECLIDDDGIGRKKSSELNRINKFDHKSTAMLNIEKRIVLLNKQSHNQLLKIEIIDKKDPQGFACGTTVKINFPIHYDFPYEKSFY